MKRFLLVFLIFVFDKSLAQDTLAISNYQVIQSMLQNLDHELVLTETQKEKMLDVLNRRVISLNRIAERIPFSKIDKSSIKEINEIALKEISKVLTDEQYSTFLTLRQDLMYQKSLYLNEAHYKSYQDIVLDF